MLDDPNLGIKKMWEIISSARDIFGITLVIVVALLLYLYRYEIGLFIKYGFSKKKDKSYMGISKLLKTNFSELEKKDFDGKVENLLNKFSSPSIDEDNEVQELTEVPILSKDFIHVPPSFRTLKAIRNEDEITCYFVNEGGAIQEFTAKSSENIIIHFSPENRIELNESGHIKFRIPKNYNKNLFRFKLIYNDDANQLHQIKYQYSLTENRLSSYE